MPVRRPLSVEWMQRIRLRVFALVLGLLLATIATLSLTTLPAWPVVGVAVAAAAFAVNTMVAKLRLEQPVCLHCGQDLSQQTAGVYGVVCPTCGTIDASLLAERDEAKPLGDLAADDFSEDLDSDDDAEA